MNKRNTVPFFCLLFISLALIPTAFSIVTTTVVYPNGGEIILGQTDLLFTVSDNNTSQSNFQANLYYSSNAGSKENLIASNIDLFSYCDFETGAVINIDNLFKGTGIVGANVYGPVGITIGQVDGNLVFLAVDDTSPFDFKGYYWNGTTWSVSTALQTGLPSSNLFWDYELFEYNGNSYLMISIDDNVVAYKWNATTNVWAADYTIVKNIAEIFPTANKKKWTSLSVFEYNSELWLLKQKTNTDFNSLKYNSVTGWQKNNYFSQDFNTQITGNLLHSAYADVDILEIDGVLWAFVGDKYNGSTSHTITGGYFDSSIGIWVSDTTYASTISTVSTFNQALPITSYDYNNTHYVLTFGWVTPADTFHGFVLLGNGYKTNLTTTCTYPFDFSTALNGTYYFDANAFVANSSGLDSSNSFFSVFSWDDSDIACECISNCSSCTLDVNAFVVVPTNQSNDVSFKVNNYTSTKNVGFRIQNSLTDGGRYKVFEANEDFNVDGIWNFNDTLTWGTTNYNSIQKIWSPSNSRFEYSYADLLSTNETIYYKLNYYHPAFAFSTVNSSLWDNQLPPSITDYNGFSTDLFSISTFSNMGSFLKSPKFPAISSNLASTSYVFQATARADASSVGVLRTGIVSDDSLTPPTALNLTSAYKTITVAGLENGFFKLGSVATTARDFYLQSYAISERGYFTQPLAFSDVSGGELPVILYNSTTWKYIAEGKNFVVSSQYYDPDGIIDRYEISAYISSISDVNRVKRWLFDSPGTGLITINETVGDLIDLTASAPNREIKLTLRLIDDNGSYFQIQSGDLLLLQFPYFPNDLKINPFILNKKVGFPPKGTIDLYIKDPESLRGVNFYIWRTITGSPEHSDYNKTFYKTDDFSCTGFDCSFDYEITDWLFPDTTGTYALTVSALLTTELEDYNSTLTAKTIYFKVYWKEFDTARNLEMIERNADHKYRNDEEIPLVMQLRDKDYSNMKEDVSVWLTLSSCDAAAAGNCTVQDINYMPTAFLYDAKTGYNYFFWRQIFIDSNGSLLADGNYYRVMGTISDAKGKHQTEIYPYLAAGCQDYDLDYTDLWGFIPNALGALSHYLFGCNTYTSALVTTTDNSAEELRLVIDNSITLTAPTQECFFCLNADQNNLYTDQLKQELICGAWYKFNKAPIDSFKFYLTNKNSDLSKTGADAQYLEFEVPYPQILFNDLMLMIKIVESKSGTTPDTIGDLIFEYANSIFVGVANPLLVIPETLTSEGLITNVGFDCNFSNPLSPTYINGLIWFKIKGLSVLNQQDYLSKYPDLENVKTSDLLEYMNYKGYSYASETTKIEVIGSDDVLLKTSEVKSPLVINEPYSDTTIKQENVTGTSQYKTLPTKLMFTAINDLIYNGERNLIRRFVPFTITAVIEPMSFSIGDAFATGIALLSTNPGLFFVKNWFIIFIGIITLLVVAVIYSKFKGQGDGRSITEKMVERYDAVRR